MSWITVVATLQEALLERQLANVAVDETATLRVSEVAVQRGIDAMRGNRNDPRMLLEEDMPGAEGKMKQFASWFTHGVPNGSALRQAVHHAKSGREIPLTRINDIAYRQRFFERLIGAGDLLVESAVERGQEVLRMVPRPMRVQQAIYQQMAKAGADKARYQP